MKVDLSPRYIVNDENNSVMPNFIAVKQIELTLGGPTDRRPKDRGYGMLAFLRGWGAGRKGLHPKDDRRR